MIMRCYGHIFARNAFGLSCQTIVNGLRKVQIRQASIVTINGLKDVTEQQQQQIKWIENAQDKGFEVPKTISLRNFLILCSMEESHERIELLQTLCAYEKRMEEATHSLKQFKKFSGAKREKLIAKQNHIKYDLIHNTFYIHYNKQSFKSYFNASFFHHYSVAPNIVIDCDFDSLMNRVESKVLSDQIVKASRSNSQATLPSNVHLCNVVKTSNFYSCLQTAFNAKYQFPIYIHEKSYLDIFGGRKIIYLSPDARNEMTNYDPDAVYIIGGIFGRLHKPITLAKAKKENIPVQKIPLNRYLKIRKNQATLDVPVVVNILNSLQIANDWKEALKHVPCTSHATWPSNVQTRLRTTEKL